MDCNHPTRELLQNYSYVTFGCAEINRNFIRPLIIRPPRRYRGAFSGRMCLTLSQRARLLD